MSTFSELQTLTTERCGIHAADASVGAVNTGPLAQLVRTALHRIETAHQPGWDWLRFTGDFTLIAGTDAYSYADVATGLSIPGIMKIHEARITSPSTGPSGSFVLERTSRVEADTNYPYTAQQLPQVWWTEGLNFGVAPIPDDAYPVRLTVLQTETDLTAGGDVPIMPVAYHDVIVDRAAELWFRRVHNIPDAQVAAASASERIREMKAHQRPYTGAGHVRVRAGDFG